MSRSGDMAFRTFVANFIIRTLLTNGDKNEDGNELLRHVVPQDNDAIYNQNLQIIKKLRCRLSPRRDPKVRHRLRLRLRFGGTAW